MPKRTNDFQCLVRLIQSTLAPKGATVQESAMVPMAGLSQPREIDILIEGMFGPFRMKVAVEAKDEKRPMDVMELDSYAAKYRGEGRIQVDKFVLVTRRGFTKTAKQKAALLDVELLTLDQAEAKDWAAQLPNAASIRFEHAPHLCVIIFSPPIDGSDTQEFKQQAKLICHCDKCRGRDLGPVWKYVWEQMMNVLRAQSGKVREFIETVRQSPTGSGFLETTIPRSASVIRFCEHDYPFNSYTAKVHYVSASAKLKCADYTMQSTKENDKSFRHLEANVGGKLINIVIPTDKHPEKIILDIASAPPPEQEVPPNASAEILPAHEPFGLVCHTTRNRVAV